MPGFTAEQALAIDSRGENLLLSAAAGSGKTTVLVERVKQLVLGGADVDSMLVVTFTRAAASGMREKLARALSERAEAGDTRCRDQLLRLERASITTIHSFCANFLRDNFEAADVDPAFSVMDEADAALLRDKALDEALEEVYGDMTGAIAELDYGRGAVGVKEAAAALMSFTDSRPDPDIWLERALSGDIGAWKTELTGAARRAASEAEICVRQALLLELPAHYVNALRADAEALSGISGITEYDEMRAALLDFKLTSPRGRNAGFDAAAIDEAKSLREAAAKALKNIAITELPPRLSASDSCDTLRAARALSDIVRLAREKEDAAKAERSQLMYGDLEIRTLRALSNDAVRDAARERYEYVFIDEYQDTSEMQDAIIAKVSRPGNLFMVGDVKQSIYRFRQAEPRLFLGKYADYSENIGGKMLPLTRNFRTDAAPIAFINAVFERLMVGGDTDILYDNTARLKPGSDDAAPGTPPEIHIISGASDDDMKSAQREGVLIAGLIKRAMREDGTLKYSDFAVITRQGARAFDAIEPMLIAEGIPAAAERGGALFSTTEVALALTYLKLIDNFRSDIELIGALRSCVCSLSIEELARIRLCARNCAFSDAVLECAKGEGELPEKLREFLATVDMWRLCAGSESLGELTRRVISESTLYAWAGALPDGARRRRNLDALVARAADYDRDVSGSLSRFLAFAEAMRDRGDSAAPVSGADDVVRLMTAHHSKGLEFRVVIGALFGSRLPKRRNEDTLLCHGELGLGLLKYDEKLRTRRLTLSRAAIAERLNREDAAEELRVLYVLLTRTKNRLLLVGTIRDIEKSQRSWRASAHAPHAGASYLDMIMSALDGRACAEVFEHAAADISRGVHAETAARRDIAPDEALLESFKWVYPHADISKMPIKLTASGLLRGLEGPTSVETPAPRPEFMREGGMTSVERGTACHLAIQLTDLGALGALSGSALRKEIFRQLNEMYDKMLLDEAQYESVDPGMLARFFESGAGRRMRAARDVRRELPFNLMLKAGEALLPGEAANAEAEVLVQGTIDCCFTEDGKWVILDYKTGYLDDPEKAADMYARQLALYAKALERITGVAVREKLLCLISRGEEISL